MDFGALPLDLLAKIFTGAGWAGGWVTLVWVLMRHNRQVMNGDLVPRKTHQDALEANRLLQARADLQAQSLERLTEAAQTTEQFIAAAVEPRTAARRLPRGRAS